LKASLQFSAECVGERTLKMGPNLAKLWTRRECLVFDLWS